MAKILNLGAPVPIRRAAGSAGVVFHVLNRGVRRMRLFDSATDYLGFLVLLGRAERRVPVEIFAYCLMPNHFHLVLRPRKDGQLSRFMHWLSVIHCRRWHGCHGTNGTGAVYQGRFKSIPVHADRHFLQVCRYVERNPLRAGLVGRAEEWPWSSAAQRGGLRRPLSLQPWPAPVPEDWTRLLNEEAPASETAEIRRAVRRSTPYGPELWRERIGTDLGLLGTRRPRRPPDRESSNEDSRSGF